MTEQKDSLGHAPGASDQHHRGTLFQDSRSPQDGLRNLVKQKHSDVNAIYSTRHYSAIRPLHPSPSTTDNVRDIDSSDLGLVSGRSTPKSAWTDPIYAVIRQLNEL